MNELLISVQSLVELEQALAAGIRWIDLKDPLAGPLGCPAMEVALQISNRLSLCQPVTSRREPNGSHPFDSVTSSIALGEIVDSNDFPLDLTRLTFDYVKVALSNCADWPDWRTQAKEWSKNLPPENGLILVYYADHLLARSPSFAEVLKVAAEIGCPYLLIDTYSKSRGRLFDWHSLGGVRNMIDATHNAGIKISIAGSLRLEDLDSVCNLQPDVIAMRGAACRNGMRSDTLCNERLTRLVHLIREQPCMGDANVIQ